MAKSLESISSAKVLARFPNVFRLAYKWRAKQQRKQSQCEQRKEKWKLQNKSNFEKQKITPARLLL